jgi:hypothetical protein
MAEESTFRGILGFFVELGIYDVILPFLLVFTIVFAILEKTRVLGVETINNTDYTKKSLNSMVAFVVSLLVVASSRLVAAINEAMANIVLLLLLSVSFLMLVGSFYHYEEKVELSKGWKGLFMVIMFVGIVAIFLQAIKVQGKGILSFVWNYLSTHWESNFAVSIVFVVIIIAFMLFITSTPAEAKPKTEKK